MPKTVSLTSESESVKYLCEKDKRLAKVISKIGDLSYTTHGDNPYGFLIHEIIEQMLSVKAGNKIYSRLTHICRNHQVTVDSIDALSDEQIKSIGTSNPKVKYIRSLTEAVKSGKLDFDELSNISADDVTARLTSVRGIGIWTSKMYLIFVLDCQDILPYEDVAFLQAYEWLYKTKDRSPETVKKKCKKW